MKISSELSHKISVLSILAMVSVVFIHARSLGTNDSVAPWCIFLETLLTRSLTCWAVPFFLVVSGFFFARGRYVNCDEGYIPFMRKKAASLLEPYLLWAVIGTLVGLWGIVGNNYITHRGLLERTFLSTGTWWGAVDRLLGITANGPMGNLALWYVRALIIFFLAAPLWRLVLKNRWLCLMLSLGLISVGDGIWMPYLSLHYSTIGWLLFGCSVARFGWAEMSMPCWITGLSLILYIGMALYMCIAQVQAGVVEGYRGDMICVTIEAMSGIISIWGLYNLLDGLKYWKMPSWASETFWVYCMHGSILGYFVALGRFLLGKTSLIALLITIVSPWLTLAICYGSCILAKRYIPRVAMLLTGNRGAPIKDRGTNQ